MRGQGFTTVVAVLVLSSVLTSDAVVETVAVFETVLGAPTIVTLIVTVALPPGARVWRLAVMTEPDTEQLP